MAHDLDTPEGRYAAIEALGPERYNAAMAEHQAKNVIKTVAGHELRYVATGFGRLIAIGNTGRAYRTLAEAEQFAEEHPMKDEGWKPIETAVPGKRVEGLRVDGKGSVIGRAARPGGSNAVIDRDGMRVVCSHWREPSQ